MRGPVLVASLALLLAASPVAAKEEVVYFLHATGQCGGGGEVEYFMDRADADGDLDGCGSIGTAGAAGSGFDTEYPAKEGLNFSIPKAQAAKAHLFVTTNQPDTLSVDVSFSAGTGTCSGSSDERAYNPVLEEWAEFEIGCEFSAEAKPGLEPSLTLTVHAAVAYFMGYEGDHASRFDLGMLEPGSGANTTANATSPAAGDSPGLGVAVVLGAAFALVAAIARGRREG